MCFLVKCSNMEVHAVIHLSVHSQCKLSLGLFHGSVHSFNQE